MLTHIITNPEAFSKVAEVYISGSDYIYKGRFDGDVTICLKDGKVETHTGEHSPTMYELDYGFVIQEIS